MENEKQIREQFASLPLNEKISSLFKMEIATISEAVNYVVSEPMKVAEKLGDLISEFGTRVETEFKKASKVSDEPPEQEKRRPGKKSGARRGTHDDSDSAA